MTKYADTFDAVVLGNGGSLDPLTDLVELININGRAREVRLHASLSGCVHDAHPPLLALRTD